MSKRTLIVIDGMKRELFGASLLVRYLQALDLQPILCGSHTFRDYYARYVPEAVIMPHALLDLSDIAERSFLFVVPSESGNGQPDQVRNNHAGSSQNIVFSKCVDRFFCWGPVMKTILLESGVWREDQLSVTGNPATDHWFLPLPRSLQGKTKIGLTTTFRAISNATPLGKMNYFEWLDFAELNGGDGTFYEPPEHAESWLFFEASFARALGTLVKTIALQRAEHLVIRPHPLEFKTRYRYFSRLTKGRVSVDKEGTISEWLDDKTILFTYMSASALDAVIRGVPVVSMKGLLDPDAIRKKPRHFRYAYEDMMWQMSDVRQAIDYAELAAKGELRPCRDEKRMSEFLAAHFAYPRASPAAQQIAAEIRNVIEEGRRGRTVPSGRSSRRGWYASKDVLCRRVPLAAQGMALGRYLHGLLPGNQDISWSYQPWRWRERCEAMRCAVRVQMTSDAAALKGVNDR